MGIAERKEKKCSHYFIPIITHWNSQPTKLQIFSFITTDSFKSTVTFREKSMHYGCWMHPRSNTDIFKVAKAIVKWSHFLSLRFLKWTAFELDTLQKRSDKYIKLWLILSSQRAVCICFATSLLNIALCAWEVTWIHLFKLDGKNKKAHPAWQLYAWVETTTWPNAHQPVKKADRRPQEAGITASDWI